MERHIRVSQDVDASATLVLELLDETSDHHRSWYARRVKVPILGRRAWRLVRVHTGDPVEVDDATQLMDFEFGDARLKMMFPTFHGQLEVMAIADDRTAVTITGSYKPPFGPVGALVDSLGVGHVFGEGGVASLLDDLVDHIDYAEHDRRAADA